MFEDYFLDLVDYLLLKTINDFFATYSFTREVAVLFAKYAIFILPFLIFFLRKKWKLALIFLLVSAVSAYLISTVIGLFYFRLRPFVDHPVMMLIHKSAFDKSFPSDHTSVAFAIALTLFFFNKRIGSCALLIALCIGIGRIAVGVHYPSDILAGIIVGISSAYVVHRLFFFERTR